MSSLHRPAVYAPFLCCLALVALYFLVAPGERVFADKSAKGGLPAVIDRVELLEDALSVVFTELDTQQSLVNALNARIDELEARVTALEAAAPPTIPWGDAAPTEHYR
jgi:hypothetical protein